jgi:hypothetical protein
MTGVSETQPRPSHTSLAAALVIGGSVGVVVGIAEQLSGLHSLETREAVASFLSEPPGDGLGLDVPGALALLRVALMVVAGCATAAAVLGFHALRGSRRARLGLSLLAAPIFVGGLATGGFLTSLVAAASLLLWVGPSGAWFRGEPTAPPRSQAGTDREQRGSTGGTDPFAAAPPRPEHEDQPPAAAPPEPFSRGQDIGPQPPARRPDALVWACVLTWACCAITIVVLVVSAVLISTNPDLVLDQLRAQGRQVAVDDVDLLRVTTYVVAAVAGLWSLGAIVIAGLAYRGAGWARLALVVSASGAALLCLLASLSSLLALLPGVVCLSAVLLLNRAEVRAWSGQPRR